MSAHPTFAAAAEAFLRVVDSADQSSRDQFLLDLERVLVDLYAAGLTLENLPPDDEAQPSEGLTNEAAVALRRRIAEKLADYDYYSVVFDPYDQGNPAPVTGSLADDVTDVYSDLQDGFADLRAGRTANALWQWKFGFEHHWGRHAAEAIYALYSLRSRPLG